MQAMINQGGEVLNRTAINNAQFAKMSAQEKFKKPMMKVMQTIWHWLKKNLLKQH